MNAPCGRKLVKPMPCRSITRLFSVMACIFGSGMSHAIEPPAVSIDFAFPAIVLLNEQRPFTITFSNSTIAPIPIISDAERASAKQVFVEVKYSDTNLLFQLRWPLRPDRIKYVEADGDWGRVLSLSDTNVVPGGSHTWRGRDLSSDAMELQGTEAKAIRAHVVYGSNTWASSPWSQINVVDKYVDDLPVIVTNILLCGPQQNPMESFLHKGVIEGREFVFTEGGSRLCEIPPGVEPEFTWNPTAYVGRISFPNTTNAPVIYDGRRGEIISEGGELPEVEEGRRVTH